MIITHRREEWGIGIRNICLSLKEIIEQNENVDIFYLVFLRSVLVQKYKKIFIIIIKRSSNERYN
jgi:UDP-N-acetylglucosamine 2-epimerase (non-hydrolysing)